MAAQAPVRSRTRVLRAAAAGGFALALSACGGGGGGDGGGGSASVSVTPASVSFVAFSNDSSFDSQRVTLSWTGANVAGFAVGTLPGVPALPPWLIVNAPTIAANPTTLALNRLPVAGLAAGTYSTTVRVVIGDTAQNSVGTADIEVSLQVLPESVVAPSAVSLSWVESERPAVQQVTVESGLGVQVSGADTDVPWLTASFAGNAVSIAPTAVAETLAPGAYTATASVSVTRPGGGISLINVPVSATVSAALGGQPVPVIELEVNGATQIAELASYTSTLTSATRTPVSFDLTSDVPWIAPRYGLTTGSPNNLVVALQVHEIRRLAHGIYDGTITLVPSAPNVARKEIAVRLRVNLPEVRAVMPVASTDTVASDYVVVHGRGLSQPNIDLRVGGGAPQSVTVVDDRTLHVVPGPRTAGDYAVTVANALGLERGSAHLRVTPPRTYAPFSLAVPIGLQARIVPSSVNEAVYTDMCYFCVLPSSPGATSTVHRFAYDSGTGQWVHTERQIPRLFDIALTPDESKLIVVTDSELLLADPVTLTASAEDTFSLPSFVGGTAYQLAVSGDGLVFIGDSSHVFSLLMRTFVPAPSGHELGRAPVASGDGSLVLLPYDEPLKAYKPATGEIVATNVRTASAARASVSRHGTALSAFTVLNADLSVRGTLPFGGSDVSPDGTRVYVLDADHDDVRVFDVTDDLPFAEELPSINVPGALDDHGARLAVDASGKHLFYVSDQRFVVVPLP